MKNAYTVLIAVLFFSSCSREKREDGRLFTLLPSSMTHIGFVNQLTETEQLNIIEYLYFNNGAGVAAGDINNDGLVDLYFTSNQQFNKLYLNKGGFLFEDITDKAGVAGTGGWKTGVTMADVNGDGLLDMYVCEVGDFKGLDGKNQLFINRGDLTFEDEADAYGLDFKGFSTQAAFFDYDLDGDLDMYLLNHSVHTSRSYGDTTLRFEYDVRAGDRLYRNDLSLGEHTFRDVTRESGIYSSQIGYGLGVHIADIDNDGYPDIYVSNDFHENDYLYINNGDGTFSDQLTKMIAHTSRSSMGNDVGDINNDGLLDIVVLDMLPDKEKILKQSGGEDDFKLFEIKRQYGYYYQFVRNTLQLNLGGGMFSEIGRLAGIYATDWSWSPLFCDVDNDGWKDLFITNGIYRRANDLDYVKFLTGGNRYFPSKDNRNVPDKVLYEKMPLYPNVNYIYKNNGDLTFTNMAKKWGFEKRSYSNGSTYADLDNDGDLDLIINNINDEAFIYRNNTVQRLDNHFLSVGLKGNGLNVRSIGARVTLYCNGQVLVAEQFPTRGFMSATSDLLHFGLGVQKIIDSLVVRWPDRSEQVLVDVAADRKITLDITNAVIPVKKSKQGGEDERIFIQSSMPGLEFHHRENAYVDFDRDRLMPHKLSAEGPAVAVGDVNDDRLSDVFVGGSKGQAAVLFIQQQGAGFKALPTPVFLKDRVYEDVDASLFDADGDGDLDLYIARGGNEAFDGDPLLADRLLMNDGNGVFDKGKMGALPFMAHNGSCVRPADIDGDGDLDLFVGSRSLPGAYGLSPGQFLLENDGNGVFKDVTSLRMNGLKDIGMVTDGKWLDYDQDSDPDLVLVGEWMEVKLFRNDDGHFEDVTLNAGLSKTSGWWNCVQVADIDQDGDLDMIGGNLGLNSVLKASNSEPVEMYLNDFDNNGSLDQVICSYKNGVSYPIASLDELAGHIAGLKKKYPNYSDFGGKTAKDIFGQKKLEQALVKRAVLFESCLFLNRGDGSFEIIKLPVFTQFSPIRDIVVRDFNRDGENDLVLVGNNYVAKPSVGRYDASYGWCLLGCDRDMSVFSVLMPVVSGLKVEGDAREVRGIDIGNKHYLLTVVNDGKLQIFEY